MSKLILTRHGQSIWNAENRFTGWVDVDLSEKGKEDNIFHLVFYIVHNNLINLYE